MQKELSENKSKDFIDGIKDSTDVTLAADDDQIQFKQSFVTNVTFDQCPLCASQVQN